MKSIVIVPSVEAVPDFTLTLSARGSTLDVRFWIRGSETQLQVGEN